MENIISPEFKEVGNQAVLIPLNIDDKGMLDFNQLKNNYTRVKELIDAGKIISASTVKTGGIARSISEMAFGNKIGFRFVDNYDEEKLFLPLYGSIIVEIKGEAEESLKGIEYEVLGRTTKEKYIEVSSVRLDLEELIAEWIRPLEDVFPINKGLSVETEESYYKEEGIKSSRIKIAKPRVFIPIFTGTFGEYDIERAFKEARLV